MRYSKLDIFFSFLLCLGLQTGVAQAQFHSKVTILVTDALGNRLPAQSVTIAGSPVNQDEAIGLPYGQYTVTASVAGAAPFKESVTIDQPSQIVIASVKLGILEGSEPAPCSILGNTTDNEGREVLRVRAMQLFGSKIVDVPVSEKGRFQIRNLTCGDYLLIAFGNSGLLGTMATRAKVLPSVLDMKFSVRY